ncbi:hypothetical protein P4283_10885 [Bacillus thuringiensis]|nr:hypothetical protein [Bacillus thuringiensis]
MRFPERHFPINKKVTNSILHMIAKQLENSPSSI